MVYRLDVHARWSLTFTCSWPAWLCGCAPSQHSPTRPLTIAGLSPVTTPDRISRAELQASENMQLMPVGAEFSLSSSERGETKRTESVSWPVMWRTMLVHSCRDSNTCFSFSSCFSKALKSERMNVKHREKLQCRNRRSAGCSCDNVKSVMSPCS